MYYLSALVHGGLQLLQQHNADVSATAQVASVVTHTAKAMLIEQQLQSRPKGRNLNIMMNEKVSVSEEEQERRESAEFEAMDHYEDIDSLAMEAFMGGDIVDKFEKLSDPYMFGDTYEGITIQDECRDQIYEMGKCLPSARVEDFDCDEVATNCAHADIITDLPPALSLLATGDLPDVCLDVYYIDFSETGILDRLQEVHAKCTLEQNSSLSSSSTFSGGAAKEFGLDGPSSSSLRSSSAEDTSSSTLDSTSVSTNNVEMMFLGSVLTCVFMGLIFIIREFYTGQRVLQRKNFLAVQMDDKDPTDPYGYDFGHGRGGAMT